MNSWIRRRLPMGAALAWIAGCAAGASNGSSDNGGSFGNGGGQSTGGGASSGGGFGGAGTGAADAGAPPETKVESDYQSPVATGRIVWTANPISGRVAYVDAVSFDVQTVQAGNGPTYLAAVPSSDKAIEQAIVLNVRSHDATLLTHDANAAAGSAALTPKTFTSTADANSWSVSPSGNWAIAWTDATHVANADPTQGFQDVAVLDLASNKSGVLSVGYRPSQVAFAKDESQAFIVTEDGISVIGLTAGAQPTLTDNFALSAPVDADASASGSGTDGGAAESSTSDAPSDAPPAGDAAPDAGTTTASDAAADSGVRDAAANDAATPATNTAGSGMPDVSFTPDGAFALVRQDGVAAITVVSLKDGTPTRIAFSSAPTDLTVAPDGTFAVAVLRDSSTVAILPLPAIASDTTSMMTKTIAGQTIGRAIVAEDQTTKQTSILLFTTVAPIDQLTVLTLPGLSTRTIKLYSPVLAVFATPNGQNAIVLHNVTPTAGSMVKGAFSIVPIAQNLPAKIVSLPAPPTSVALAPASDRAIVTFRDDTSTTYGAELAMMPSLEVLPFALASPPTAAGIAAAAGTGFVAQNYSDGRITFIDLDAGAARTITGFELGARVVQGSNP